MAEIQTVQGRIPADSVGFTLPHEHTAIALWHIANRWDYWELTADEPVVATELESFRALGGTCIADLTLPGVGRDPAWLLRIAANCCYDLHRQRRRRPADSPRSMIST